VGETSAWGVDAGLGPTCPGELAGITTGCDHRLSVPAYHVWKSPGETSDPEIISDVIGVAGMLESQPQPSATAAAVRPAAQGTVLASGTASAASADRSQGKASTKPSIRLIALTSVGGGIAKASQSVSVPTQSALVSEQPFTVSCDGKSWEAENVAPEVWAMFGGALQCTAVARIPAGTGYLTATVSPRTSIRVRAIARNRDITVRVSGAHQLSATLSRPGWAPIRFRRTHGAWQATVSSRRDESATITVVSNHQVLRGALTL